MPDFESFCLHRANEWDGLSCSSTVQAIGAEIAPPVPHTMDLPMPSAGSQSLEDGDETADDYIPEAEGDEPPPEDTEDDGPVPRRKKRKAKVPQASDSDFKDGGLFEGGGCLGTDFMHVMCRILQELTEEDHIVLKSMGGVCPNPFFKPERAFYCHAAGFVASEDAVHGEQEDGSCRCGAAGSIFNLRTAGSNDAYIHTVESLPASVQWKLFFDVYSFLFVIGFGIVPHKWLCRILCPERHELAGRDFQLPIEAIQFSDWQKFIVRYLNLQPRDYPSQREDVDFEKLLPTHGFNSCTVGVDRDSEYNLATDLRAATTVDAVLVRLARMLFEDQRAGAQLMRLDEDWQQNQLLYTRLVVRLSWVCNASLLHFHTATSRVGNPLCHSSGQASARDEELPLEVQLYRMKPTEARCEEDDVFRQTMMSEVYTDRPGGPFSDSTAESLFRGCGGLHLMVVFMGNLRKDAWEKVKKKGEASAFACSGRTTLVKTKVIMVGRIGPHAVRSRGQKPENREINTLDELFLPVLSVKNLSEAYSRPFKDTPTAANIVQGYRASRKLNHVDFDRSVQPLKDAKIEHAARCTRGMFKMGFYQPEDRTDRGPVPSPACPKLMLGQCCTDDSCKFSHYGFHFCNSFQHPVNVRGNRTRSVSTVGLDEFYDVAMPIAVYNEKEFGCGQKPCIGCGQSDCRANGGLSCLQSDHATCAHHVCYRCGQGNVDVAERASFRKFSHQLFAKNATPASEAECDCGASHKVFFLPRCSGRVGLPCRKKGADYECDSFGADLRLHEQVYFKNMASKKPKQEFCPVSYNPDNQEEYTSRSGLDFSEVSTQMNPIGTMYTQTAPCFGTVGMAILFQRYLGEFNAYESNRVFSAKVDEILNDALVRIVLGLSSREETEEVVGIPIAPESPRPSQPLQESGTPGTPITEGVSPLLAFGSTGPPSAEAWCMGL
jgi:hypothetical protein